MIGMSMDHKVGIKKIFWRKSIDGIRGNIKGGRETNNMFLLA